jgi:hypothetical protein
VQQSDAQPKQQQKLLLQWVLMSELSAISFLHSSQIFRIYAEQAL